MPGKPSPKSSLLDFSFPSLFVATGNHLHVETVVGDVHIEKAPNSLNAILAQSSQLVNPCGEVEHWMGDRALASYRSKVASWNDAEHEGAFGHLACQFRQRFLVIQTHAWFSSLPRRSWWRICHVSSRLIFGKSSIVNDPLALSMIVVREANKTKPFP